MDSKTKEKIIRPIKNALLKNDSLDIGNALKQAARQAHLVGERNVALSLIEFALNFLENSNSFTLVLVDWYYYKTGNRVNLDSINFELPQLKEKLPIEELKDFLNKL